MTTLTDHGLRGLKPLQALQRGRRVTLAGWERPLFSPASRGSDSDWHRSTLKWATLKEGFAVASLPARLPGDSTANILLYLVTFHIILQIPRAPLCSRTLSQLSMGVTPGLPLSPFSSLAPAMPGTPGNPWEQPSPPQFAWRKTVRWASENNKNNNGMQQTLIIKGQPVIGNLKCQFVSLPRRLLWSLEETGALQWCTVEDQFISI